MDHTNVKDFQIGLVAVNNSSQDAVPMGRAVKIRD